MFRVFTAVLCVAMLSVVSVNCAIDDTIAELMAQLTHLAQNCYSADSEMKLHHLAYRDATCNDGTPAGYYLRKAHGSKRWIVYLEGGWFCDSADSCRKRYHTMQRGLMSSKGWRETKKGMGILSPDPRENPSWWNANHVYIPYCSSDAWSGNASMWETGDGFSFLGTKILERVIQEISPEGLYHAKHLLLAGSSAGGIGVILNLDRLAMRLRMAGSKVHVRGLADSGWYLTGGDFRRCLVDGTNCDPAAEAIKKGMAYWRGVVPDDCARRNPNEKWKCYFGEHVYRTDSESPKHSPLFVFQWLYDEVQVAWLVSQLNEKENLNVTAIAISLGAKLKESFTAFNCTKGKVCGVFAPSCVAHTILTRNNWLKVKVSGKTLNNALDAWYQSSDQSSASCKTLIESECNFPHCGEGCKDISSQSPVHSPRSSAVPPNPASRKRKHRNDPSKRRTSE